MIKNNCSNSVTRNANRLYATPNLRRLSQFPHISAQVVPVAYCTQVSRLESKVLSSYASACENRHFSKLKKYIANT